MPSTWSSTGKHAHAQSSRAYASPPHHQHPLVPPALPAHDCGVVVTFYRYAEELFEERWHLMLSSAPERVQADRYECHGTRMLRCLPPETVHSEAYTGRRRCFTYCTNRATEDGAVGERLRRAYEAGCPSDRSLAITCGDMTTMAAQPSAPAPSSPQHPHGRHRPRHPPPPTQPPLFAPPPLSRDEGSVA